MVWSQETELSGLGAAEALGAIADLSDDAIIVCDSEGRVRTWNAGAERLFGLPSPSAAGRPLAGLFADHVRAAVEGVVERVEAGELVRHFDTEVRRSDGLPVPVSLSLRSVVGRTGDLPGMVALLRDTTEQRLAQAMLAEVEVRVEEGEALAHVGSWMWDRRTGVVQWSQEFHRIHGVDPLEFGGTLEAYLDVVHPADRAGLRDAMARSVGSGRPLDEQYRVAPPGGAVRVVHVRGQPTPDSSGAVVGLRGIGQLSAVTDQVADPGDEIAPRIG